MVLLNRDKFAAAIRQSWGRERQRLAQVQAASASCRTGPAWNQLLQEAAAKASSKVSCLLPVTGNQNICYKSWSFHSPGGLSWSVVMPEAQSYQHKHLV